MNNHHLFPAGIFRFFIHCVVTFSLLSGCSEQSENQAKPPIPTEKEITALTNKTTLDFAHAVNARDLALFLDSTAEDFKHKFTAQQFNNAFRGFIEQKINLLAIQPHAPVFEQPPNIIITDIDTLVVQGYYPTVPSQVQFHYTFKRDPTLWKIIGIDIKVLPQS